MAAYSLDLRERIINAVERGDQTKRAVAALFEVHESFIYKLLRQQREAGHFAPLPHGGSHTAKLLRIIGKMNTNSCQCVNTKCRAT